MIKVFAFGTLKKGFPLHDAALRDALYLGVYRTVQRYPMLIAGPWFAPMMLDEPGVGLQVTGELYDVQETRLPAIDAMESVGKPGNLRIPVAIEPLVPGPQVKAVAYVKTRELAAPLHSDLLAEYLDRRFIPPWRRK